MIRKLIKRLKPTKSSTDDWQNLAVQSSPTQPPTTELSLRRMTESGGWERVDGVDLSDRSGPPSRPEVFNSYDLPDGRYRLLEVERGPDGKIKNTTHIWEDILGSPFADEEPADDSENSGVSMTIDEFEAMIGSGDRRDRERSKAPAEILGMRMADVIDHLIQR